MHEELRPPDMNDQEPDWDALARFVAGESDQAEARVVSQWLASHPADAELVRGVKAHAEQAESGARVTVNVEAALQRVRARPDFAAPVAAPAAPLSLVQGSAPRGSGTARAPGSRRWGPLVFAAAATVVAMLGVRQWLGGGQPAGREQVLATAVGTRDSLTLADGSKVVLAPGSRLVVAAGFAAGDRTVTLEGAAYFDVTHDDAHPFTVRSSGAEIRDLGTSFSVKTDATGAVAVAVTHGIVALRDTAAGASAAVELRAGDRGVMSAGTVAVSRGTVSPDDMAWTRGELSYRDATLSEVQSDLRRWYGLRLQVTDSALSRLTVTMPAQPDAERLIRTLSALLGADAEQRGDTVFLRSAGRGTTP